MSECMNRDAPPVTLPILDFVNDWDMAPTGETVTVEHDQCHLYEGHDGPHHGFHAEWPK